MKEVWKPITGYEGRYDVSNMGNVLSHITNKTLKPTLSNTGYFHVQLYGIDGASVKLIHKLVAEEFIPNPCQNPEVNHIDGDKQNNRFDNLEWVTKSENQRHAITHGLRTPSPKIQSGNYTDLGRPVIQYTTFGSFVRIWESISQAAKFYSCSPSSISACVTGHTKTCRGYVWKYYIGKNIQETIPPVSYSRGTVKGKTWTQSNKRPCRKIAQYSKDGSLIKVWDSYKTIVAQTGYDNGCIYACINGRLKTAYGYIWKYAE